MRPGYGWRRKTLMFLPVCSIVTMGLFWAVTIAIFTTPCRKKMRSPFSGITCWLEKIFYIRYRKIDLSEFVNFARLRLIND